MAAHPGDPPRHFYSLDEYFALEHTGDARYEYWDGEIFCISGGRLAHGIIGTNIIQSLGRELSGTRCRALSGSLAINTPSLPPYRYPDASVVCGEPKVENTRGVDTLLNPVLIVEVASPSTEIRDRGDKFRAYQQIPGFQEYLLVAQDTALITHWGLGPNGVWSAEEHSGLGTSIQLGAVDCVLFLAEIYEDVTLTAD
jgi:Uma2 family endonuclease